MASASNTIAPSGGGWICAFVIIAILSVRMPHAAFSRENPPQSLCLLRTSALGDVTHVVPLVRTLQANSPRTRLTWIVGKLEHKLVGDIPGVEFLVFDKSAGWRGFAALRRHLSGRRFDALLHLQVRSEERRVGKECRSRWSPY